ncbi:MAG TPA: hypothetical protein EYH02_02625 [Ignisphaera aggregans]|uniref:tRNA (guanine(26)-N(2))-dimethyltransferase n=1 Tax=Ignisphaera aggregans TaxID=334771 RepID=A0A832YXV7_9CREN|nr:hypothetical protein [Ignisphaera aggregans]
MSCPEGFKVCREGRAVLCLPNPELYKREDGVYEPAWAPVFYNPVMVENRDIAIAFLRWASQSRTLRLVVDPLASTGVRGIRIALEVPQISEVVMGDIDEYAVNIMNINIRLNNVESKVKALHADANELLFSLFRQKAKIEYIDIDPFGSPAPFAFAALYTIRNGGYIAFTATDLAPLEGKYPQKLYRRYGVIGRKNIISKEVAIRNLLAFLAREAAKIDKVIIPLVAYYSRHYIRVYLRIAEGGLRANELLSKCIGSIVICDRCGFVEYFTAIDMQSVTKCPICGSELSLTRFTWICSIRDKEVTMKVCDIVSSDEVFAVETKKLALRLSQEAEAEGKLYRVSAIARALRRNMPSPERVVSCLREVGFRAARSHVYPDGVVTEAPYGVVRECVNVLKP